MKEAHTFQRIVAYLIDTFIVALVLVLLTAWIPKSTQYKDAVKQEETLMNDYINKNINESEYIDKMYEAKYIEDKESICESLISVVLSLGYFVGITYYCKGQTLGKKAMHIKIVNEEGKEASYIQLFGRSLIHNGCLTSTISIIFLLFIKSNQYSYTVGVLGVMQSLIMISSTIMIICRKDKRGLHDLICRTKVIE